MDEVTSSSGALALAISALLLVVGYRLARPESAREWAAVAAYAAALAAQLLGALGLLPGGAFAPGPALRIGGAALLVAGLLLAGAPSRARRRTGASLDAETRPRVRATGAVHAGLALVVTGQLLRGPSVAGAVAAALAVAAQAWAAWRARGQERPA